MLFIVVVTTSLVVNWYPSISSCGPRLPLLSIPMNIPRFCDYCYSIDIIGSTSSLLARYRAGLSLSTPPSRYFSFRAGCLRSVPYIFYFVSRCFRFVSSRSTSFRLLRCQSIWIETLGLCLAPFRLFPEACSPRVLFLCL
ncbi:hypothetical protein BDZ97DRAFT_354747 [Flammula alnicola]|nr:hypothetical protein BDZ97DRAFT_354747 [Flammula alnicola]